MFWVIAIIIVAIIAACLDSDMGKAVMGAGVVAIGMLLLYWISGFGIFVTLAKACAVIIVLIILWLILSAIFS